MCDYNDTLAHVTLSFFTERTRTLLSEDVPQHVDTWLHHASLQVEEQTLCVQLQPQIHPFPGFVLLMC